MTAPTTDLPAAPTTDLPVLPPTRRLLARALAGLLLLGAVAAPSDEDRERGDVPGWVLITVMTAGLVTALWAVAGPQLAAMFSDALTDVTGP